MDHTTPTDRRALLAAALVLPWRLAGATTTPAPLPLTPAQTEGPFYPTRLPADRDGDLLLHGDRRYTAGQACWLEGRVTTPDGRPVAGAVVEIWQCDQDGEYHHVGRDAGRPVAFQGFGQVSVAADGSYRFRTIRPVNYPGRTPHIHVKVKQGTRELLTTQLYVEGDPGNPRDGLWRRLSEADRAAVTRPFVVVEDGLAARFPLVVRA